MELHGQISDRIHLRGKGGDRSIQFTVTVPVTEKFSIDKFTWELAGQHVVMNVEPRQLRLLDQDGEPAGRDFPASETYSNTNR
ncbi:hypothetical protein LCGC14_3120220 [marine sediment metagenome]|uniref:Uncharacterized protein n=1 Tax=marine sediment metagenome TaxID=412755 RepID=A0A0F8YA11_9ZZZZ